MHENEWSTICSHHSPEMSPSFKKGQRSRMGNQKVLTEIQMAFVAYPLNEQWCNVLYSTAEAAVSLSLKHPPYLTIHDSFQA